MQRPAAKEAGAATARPATRLLPSVRGRLPGQEERTPFDDRRCHAKHPGCHHLFNRLCTGRSLTPKTAPCAYRFTLMYIHAAPTMMENRPHPPPPPPPASPSACSLGRVDHRHHLVRRDARNGVLLPLPQQTAATTPPSLALLRGRNIDAPAFAGHLTHARLGAAAAIRAVARPPASARPASAEARRRPVGGAQHGGRQAAAGRGGGGHRRDGRAVAVGGGVEAGGAGGRGRRGGAFRLRGRR